MPTRHYRRLLTPPKGSFFLFGVRGAGKSSWAREQVPDAYVVDLLDESRYQALLANPVWMARERLAEILKHESGSKEALIKVVTPAKAGVQALACAGFRRTPE